MTAKTRSFLHPTSCCLWALAFSPSLVAQTTQWTGAVSTSWTTSGNWTNGIPSATSDTIIGPGTNPCSVPASTFSFAPVVRDLTVLANANVTVPTGATLRVHGNILASTTVAGTGRFELVNAETQRARSILCQNGAVLPTVSGDTLFPPLVTGAFTMTNLTTRGDLLFNTPTALQLNGRTEVAGTLGNQPSGGGGIASVNCEPNGTLIADTVRIRDYFYAPATMRVSRIFIPTTSAFVPAAGTVVFAPQTTTTLVLEGGYLGATTVQAGATVNCTGPGGRIYDLVCNGLMRFQDMSSMFQVTGGNWTIAGQVQFTNSSTTPSQGLTSIGNSLRIQPGGSLVFDDNSSANVYFTGTPEIDGLLQVGANVHVVTGPLDVRATGRMRMAGTSTLPARLTTNTLRVAGTLEASNYRMDFGAPTGLQLLAGSSLGAAPFDLRNGVLSSTSTDPAGLLLDIGRTAPTTLDAIQFGNTTGTNPVYGVRATTAHAVQITNATGPRAGAAFEVDPLRVVSWQRGVTYAGPASPGCLGLTECATNSEPRLGNASFAFTCGNAHPNRGAIFALGLGTATTPTVIGNLQVWVDTSLPLTSTFHVSSPTGSLFVPKPIPSGTGFLGLPLTGQFVLFEPTGCTPTGLSASTAVRTVIVP